MLSLARHPSRLKHLRAIPAMFRRYCLRDATVLFLSRVDLHCSQLRYTLPLRGEINAYRTLDLGVFPLNSFCCLASRPHRANHGSPSAFDLTKVRLPASSLPNSINAH